MARHDALVGTDIIGYLSAHERKSLLRFITCGSVDDGKSTLIGRLLYESKLIFEDQLAVLETESKTIGTQGGDLDFALLVDGLAAEREQGITIDVAYRFFTTDRRKFIVADTPGHEHYTRNMATGASTADLAVVMIDARKGILTQTRRHSYIVSMLGVRHVVLCVNKMDLVDNDQHIYNEIDEAYRQLAAELGIEHVTAIPVSALKGDNVVGRSDAMAWYQGPTLIDHLETVDVGRDDHDRPFRMPVQWVNRPNLDFRGFAGQIATGMVRPGDRIATMPSGRETTVKAIVAYGGEQDEAIAGESVTLTLNDEIDISRGDVIAAADAPPQTADQFQARILWMSETPMLPGRTYLMKIGAQIVSCTPAAPKYAVNVNTFEQLAAKTLDLNAIGVCNIALDRDIAFDAYDDNRHTGGFILIDRMTNETVGMGLLNFALRRAGTIKRQDMSIGKAERGAQKHQKPAILWFTGLSGAGKTTIADRVTALLYERNRHVMMLDGDNVRHGLNRDLGFTDADRVENIRRIAEVAKLMVDAGLITVVAFISPFRAERRMARGLVEAGEFVEIFIDTPLAVAEDRDAKGLYRKARRGEIKNFTGIDSPYEPPENSEIRIDTTTETAEEAADRIIAWLDENGYLSG